MEQENYLKYTDEERRNELDWLATEYFETKRWRASFARLCGMTPMGIQSWFKNGAPPVWSLLLIQSLTRERDLQSDIDQRNTALAQIQNLAAAANETAAQDDQASIDT